MGSSFNRQILVDKLAKLNSSQASIETLSHWCIFHMNKAKQVVETWDGQFHCAPREQRLAYLYLANDILQNSRRKGSEFVGEFWKVLPDALRDVIGHGDEFGRNAARRLINIWEERKVFGSRGQILKEEFLGRRSENGSKLGRHSAIKLKQPVGDMLERIISSYEALYGSHRDEDSILTKCSNSVSYLEKIQREIGDDAKPGQPGPGVLKDVQGQQAILKDYMDQLKSVEASRSNLVSLLRDALQEQEMKLEVIHTQLETAQSQSDQADNLCKQIMSDVNSNEGHTSTAPQTFMHAEREQSAPAVYTNQVNSPEKSSQAEDDPRRSAAAAVAAKLTASTSSAQMLSYVLSSLASEGVIGSTVNEQPSEYHSQEKRPKLERNQSFLAQNPHMGSFHEPDSCSLTTSDSLNPSSMASSSLTPLQPPMPPYQLPQYMQASGSMNMACSYNMPMPPVPGYSPPPGPPSGMEPPSMRPPENQFPNFQGPEGFYNPSSTTPIAPPITRQ